MKYEEAVRVACNESKFELLINGDLNVENAAIIFKNFAGDPTRVNPQGGKRTFSLVLNEDMARRLHASGWNIKVKEIKDVYVEGENGITVSWPDYDANYRERFDNAMIYTEIVVNENANYPPNIYKVTELDGEKSMIQVPPAQYYRLDKEELFSVDVVIHPYMHGRSIANPDAKKGYLRSMYAMAMPVNDFGGKYAGIPIVASAS